MDNDHKEMLAVFETHKLAFDTWVYGSPIECWRDNDGVLCVRYESGIWYHYRNGEWW